MNTIKRMTKLLVIGALCLTLASCEQPAIYGSVGFSTYSGGWGSPGFGTSVSIGGRIR